MTLPSASLIVTEYSTVLPIMPTPWDIERVSMAVAMFSICSTWLNWVIDAIMSFWSMGAVGSWFLSWAIMSCRNICLSVAFSSPLGTMRTGGLDAS